MTTPTPFTASRPVSFAKDEATGVYVAWGAFSKYEGEDFWDTYGDHIPEGDLVPAALSLAEAKLLKLDHEGDERGSVPMVMALSTSIKKALEIESPHAGIAVGFIPDADLKTAIDAGEVTEMSIHGVAFAENLTVDVAKSAAEVSKAKKRILHKPVIDEISVVKRGAHGRGTKISIAKRAPDGGGETAGTLTEVLKSAKLVRIERKAAPELKREPIAKGSHPALTTATNGHTHLIYDVDCEGGSTSSEYQGATSDYRTWHSHPFVVVNGRVVIGEADGHTHEIDTTATETTPMSKADAPQPTSTDAARVSLLKTAFAAALTAPEPHRAYAARLGEGAEAFFSKSVAERDAEVAANVAHTAKDGTVYYKTDDRRLVEMAKRDEAREAELAAAREANELATFSKRASTEMAHIAVEGDQTKVDIAKAKLLKAADAIGPEAIAIIQKAESFAKLACSSVGHGGNGNAEPSSDAVAEFEKAHQVFAKNAEPELSAKDMDAALSKTASAFAKSADGKRLYAAAYPPTAPAR